MTHERNLIRNPIRCYLIFIDVVSMFDVRCPCVLCMCSLICHERNSKAATKKARTPTTIWLIIAYLLTSVHFWSNLSFSFLFLFHFQIFPIKMSHDHTKPASQRTPTHSHTHLHTNQHQQNRSASMIDMYIDNSEPSENVGQIHFCVEYDFQNTTLILKILQVIIC